MALLIFFGSGPPARGRLLAESGRRRPRQPAPAPERTGPGRGRPQAFLRLRNARRCPARSKVWPVCSRPRAAGRSGFSNAPRRWASSVRRPQGFTLSDTGRAYALRVLRTHRLLERFLADRTGTRPAEWHLQAERREHQLSLDETERLARRMGHPLYDPHGDPIPTATGELPEARGTPLSATSRRARRCG